MSMTSKQVVNALIRGEKAERIGLFEHGAWQETMAAWVKQGKLLFVGGFDERILETNDHTIIRREITEYLTGMKARGARLLFATDHSISPRVHYETYRYAMEVYRENMGY